MTARSRATIADVARLAGVSTATAGRVLGGYGYTSDSKKEQVLKAARSLGYRPNALARGLITGRTSTIGVVASDIANPFYASVLRGISDVAGPAGFGLLITNSDEDLAQEVRAVELLTAKQVDGLIVSPCDTRDAAHLRALRDAGTPLVLIDRAIERLDVDRVATDNVAAASQAVTILIRQGHRRIGLVGELASNDPADLERFIARGWSSEPMAIDTLYPSWQRLLGYLHAYRAAGLDVDPALVRGTGQYAVEAARQHAVGLLSGPDRPTAIFSTDGTMSEGAMAAIAGLGMSVPGDLSIICFDELDWMGFMPPGISTMAQPRLAIGGAAAQLLLDRIGGADLPGRTLLMPAELMLRGSVATCRR